MDSRSEQLSGAQHGADGADADGGQGADWAVCCSGGGIRSASYCLGALQRLQGENANGLFGKVRDILCVSGGSYIAASRALVARDLRAADQPAYGLGSPEEENLRDNTHYLAPNAGTMLVGVLSLLVGVAVTFVLTFAPIFAIAHGLGWLMRWQQVLCPGSLHRCGTTGPLVASVSSPTWWWLLPAAAAGVTLFLFGWWWLTLKPTAFDPNRQTDPRQTLAKATGWAAVVASALAIGMLVVPLLLSWVTKLPAGPFKSLLYDLGFGAGQKWTPAALTGAFGALVAVAQSCRAKLGQLQLPGAQGKPASQTKAQAQRHASPGLVASIGGRIRTYLLPWLASAVIVLVGVIAALRWVKDGAAAGYSTQQLWPVLIALGVMVATRVLADVNRISMHDFYRWRLATAFAVRRRPAAGSSPLGVDQDPGALLSSLRGQSPRLVICATANINADREVPVGRGGLLLSFDPENVTLRGEEPGQKKVAATSDYEALVGQRRFTLFDISAISGAAISPLMGSVTRQAYRILLTVTNVRLGVWIPHPAIVDAARRELAKPSAKDHGWTALILLIWYAFPWHPHWKKDTTQEPGGREARLWAYVLNKRTGRSRRSRVIGGLFYHALQPTLGLLWAEAAGHTSYRSTWICVSDGGHYDNLGLVEALWREARNIIALDASGDKANTWFTLGGAMALAKVDAGVDIDLNPSDMCSNPKSPDKAAAHLSPGEVVKPWTHGSFTRIRNWQAGQQAPQGPPLPGTGTILVCKLGWWADAPWDIRAYAQQHPEFPGQSTLQQLYDGAEFDAYRTLGFSAMNAALKAIPGTAQRRLTAAEPMTVGIVHEIKELRIAPGSLMITVTPDE